MAEYEFLTYETLDDGRIARIMLNRPEARNAQHVPLRAGKLQACFTIHHVNHAHGPSSRRPASRTRPS